MSEEVGQWVARKTGMEFHNDEGKTLDAGAVLGLQTMTALSTEAAATNSPLMFALDVGGGGRHDFATNAASMMTVAVKQFSPARMLANISGSFGDAQADWAPSMDDVKRYAVGLAKRAGGRVADQAVMMGGMVLGVGEKGLDAVKGLATLAGDVVGTGGYLALKMAGADRLAESMFGSNYKNMVALKDATMKFVTENSIAGMAHEIFVKPLADGFTNTHKALSKAEQISSKDPEDYSLDRAKAYLDAGMEMGKFGVDVAMAILSVTGAGAAAKGLFNVGTAMGKSAAAGFAAMGRAGSISSAIEGLAGRVASAVDNVGARLNGTVAQIEARLSRQGTTQAEAPTARQAAASPERGARPEPTSPAIRVRRFNNVDEFNRAANAAEPNTAYEFGTYRWVTDDSGRVASVEGRVDMAKHGRQTTGPAPRCDSRESV